MNEKVFRDPVHNYIHVNNQVIYDLINTKEFQRLRRIKQLGTSSYTFHGGEHSRFSHCLGVYEIARRITEIFEEKYPKEWDPAESLLTMTARSFMTSGMVPTLILLNISLIQIMRPLLRKSSKVLRQRFTKSCYK